MKEQLTTHGVDFGSFVEKGEFVDALAGAQLSEMENVSQRQSLGEDESGGGEVVGGGAPKEPSWGFW